MDNSIETVEREIGHVLEIEEAIPMWKMPSTMGRDLKAISEFLDQQDIKAAGAPYSRYLVVDWKTELAKSGFKMFLEVFTKKWYMKIGMPVGAAVTGEGQMKPIHLPSARYLRTVHKGPYQKLGATYGKVGKWAEANGIELENTSIESYLNDPGNTTKADLETEILIPIR